jgi:hypothetical protein
MAEYMAGNEDAVEEEEADYDEKDSEDDGDSDEEDAPPTILKGGLEIGKDDDGAKVLTYSGMWSQVGSEEDVSKFKLRCPLPSEIGKKLSGMPTSTLTIEMSGHFVVNDDGEKSKIKEKGVELTFTGVAGKEGKRWTVSGKGLNDFGAFTLVGEYRFKDENDNKLHLEKVYTPSRNDEGDSDSADDDFDETGGADAEELAGLDEDANLSIDELKRKYQGGEEGETKGGEAGEGGGEKKKARKEKDEEEDEGEF